MVYLKFSRINFGFYCENYVFQLNCSYYVIKLTLLMTHLISILLVLAMIQRNKRHSQTITSIVAEAMNKLSHSACKEAENQNLNEILMLLYSLCKMKTISSGFLNYLQSKQSKAVSRISHQPSSSPPIRPCYLSHV